MKIEIEFEIDVAENVGSAQQLDDWVSFSLGENGQIDTLNPFLVKYGDIEAVPFSVRVRS